MLDLCGWLLQPSCKDRPLSFETILLVLVEFLFKVFKFIGSFFTLVKYDRVIALASNK